MLTRAALRAADDKAAFSVDKKGMQEQAELIGGGLAARGAVGGEMGFPGFDVIFRAAAPAVNVLVDRLSAAYKIGDDEPGVGSLFARFDARNNTFDATPTRGAVVKLLEPAHFGLLRPGLETAFGARLECFDMTAQGRGRRNARWDSSCRKWRTSFRHFATANAALLRMRL